jgi:hypothetical protein
MNDIVFAELFNLHGTYLAYIGPGTGITVLWALLAVLGGILLMVFGLVFWPVRMLIRAIKKNKSKNGNAPKLDTENSNNVEDDKQPISTSEHN